MKRTDIAPGRVRIQITSADISGMLTELCDRGIILRDIGYSDQLTVMAEVSQKEYVQLASLVMRRGGQVRRLGSVGAFRSIIRLIRRPVLMLGICVLFFLTAWIPGRVLFVQVEGNHSVPTNLILECTENCGLRFGTQRRTVRSENIKNQLLDQIPQLQWVGVNTSGCVAVVSVRERSVQELSEQGSRICSIVAQRDGIVTSCTATRGDLLCAPGQAVQTGDVLISGYTDVGLCIRATRAEGEIFATTQREITLLMPDLYAQKAIVEGSSKKISLIFGKKRINLYNGSGILGDICDRMYNEYYITLPGGFQLPLGIAIEDILCYSASFDSAAQTELQVDARRAAQDYLVAQMVGGQLQREVIRTKSADGVCTLLGSYICTEMIGTVKYEGIVENYGKNE